MGRQYQSFPDAKGHSDSAAKLSALHLPERLDGQSVLDIACNEGFFCQTAWERGAARVVGIDKHAGFIERARRRDTRTEYHVLDWARLPYLADRFDFVLLLSALHYAADPASVLQIVLDRVKPGGVLVVECGVADGDAPAWVAVERPRGDRVLHPTRPAMLEVPGASVEEVGLSVVQRGDPLPRAVFHLRPEPPTAILLSGPSGTGKSSVTRLLRESGHSAIGLDHLIATIEHWSTDPELVEMGRAHPREIKILSDMIAERGVEERFVDQVLARSGRTLRSPLTVIEGYALGCGAIGDAFAGRLADAGVEVYRAVPSSERPRIFGGTRRVSG